MCGIIGYIGSRGATPLLLEGLRRMEYRGYDSAGVAVMNGKGVETRKAASKIAELENALSTSPLEGDLGIGHTRWATHGVPNECNAHPHVDCKGHIAVVHNGIIENSGTLKQGLEARGHEFASDTDTEVIAHLIEETFDGNLDDGDVAVLTRDGYTILNQRAQQLERGVSKIDWDLDQIERGGFDHFMLKEIFEQPATVENCMRGRLLPDEGTSKLGGINLSDEQLLKFDNILITACGTSWHSALIGEHMLEDLARIPVEVEYASELRYRNPIITDKTLCIVISQSGETADTLAAMREAKARGAFTYGSVNVVGSTIARESDGGIYVHAGPEIGV